MYSSFDAFDVMSAIFPIFFILVAALVVFTIIRGLAEWNKNNQSPRLTVDAKVVSKRENTTHYQNNANYEVTHAVTMRTNTTYYVTFEVESGDRMEMCVDGQQYGMLAEGDSGKLTFQGTRYLGFDRYENM